MASRDGTVCVGVSHTASDREYIQILSWKVFKKHTGYVFALCVVPDGASVAGRYGRKLNCCVAFLFVNILLLYFVILGCSYEINSHKR